MAPEIFPDCHPEKNTDLQNLNFFRWPPEFFQIYGINPPFFQGGDPEIFLGFETDPDFSNQKSGCRFKRPTKSLLS